MLRKCPACSAVLNQIVVGSIELDTCPQCSGYWFDEQELQRLIAADPRAMESLEAQGVARIQGTASGTTERLCPKCGLKLRQYKYMYNSPIVLDTCDQCGGFWVDDGELAKMAAWRRDCRKSDAKQEAVVASAIAEGEHTEVMDREQRLQEGIEFLKTNRSGMTGLIP